MSNKVMNKVWPLKLPPTVKWVLIALADHADDDGHTWIAVRSETKPGRKPKLDLVTKTGLSERSVQRAINDLVEAGHITRVENPGKGVDTYIHPVTTPVTVAPLTPDREATPVTVTGHNGKIPTFEKASPPSERHPTPVTVAPHPRHSGTQNLIHPLDTPPSDTSYPQAHRLRDDAPLSVNDLIESIFSPDRTNDVSPSPKCGDRLGKGRSLWAHLPSQFRHLPLEAKVSQLEEAFNAIKRNPDVLNDDERKDWLTLLTAASEEFWETGTGQQAERLLFELAFR